MVGILAIDLGASESDESGVSADKLKGAIEFLLELREEARKTKNYALSDQIRDRLGQLGIVVADTKDGPTWKIE